MHDDADCDDPDRNDSELDDSDHELKHDGSDLTRLLQILNRHYSGLESLSLIPAYGDKENGIDLTNLYNILPGCLSAQLLSQPSWWQKITSLTLALVTLKDWAALKVILPRMTRLKHLYLSLFFDEVDEELDLSGISKQRLESLTILFTTLYGVDRVPEVLKLWDQVSHLSMFSDELAYDEKVCLGTVLSQIPTTWQLQSLTFTGYHHPLESHSLIESAFTPLRNITSLVLWSCLLEKMKFEQLVSLLPLIEVFKSIEFRDEDVFGPRHSAESIQSGALSLREADLLSLLGWKRLRECTFSLCVGEWEMADGDQPILMRSRTDPNLFEDYMYDINEQRKPGEIQYLQHFVKLHNDWLLLELSSRCKSELTHLQRLQIYGFNSYTELAYQYFPVFVALRCSMGKLHCVFRSDEAA